MLAYDVLRNPVVRPGAYVLPTAAGPGPAVQRSHLVAAAGRNNLGSAVITPDGTRMYFATSAPGGANGGHWQLRVADVATGTSRIVGRYNGLPATLSAGPAVRRALVIVRPAQPIPSPTPSPSRPSQTGAPSPSPTRHHSSTATPSPSPASHRSQTATPSPSPARHRSPTPSPSPSPSHALAVAAAVPSPSPSPSRPHSATASPTPSPSRRGTATPSASPTSSPMPLAIPQVFLIDLTNGTFRVISPAAWLPEDGTSFAW